MRDTGCERVPRAHTEAPVRPGIEKRSGLITLHELARVRHEVAAVTDHYCVTREALLQLAVDASGLDRCGVGFEDRPFGGALGQLVGAQPLDPIVMRAGSRA